MADNPSLLFGAFELYDPNGAAYGTAVLGGGVSSKGNPVPITVAIETFLEHGAIEATQGYDNRILPIRIELIAPATGTAAAKLDALVDAETALFAEVGKQNQLVWKPWHPDIPSPSYGTPIVFEVVNSRLEQVDTDDRTDLNETDTQPSAVYQLEITARSFVKSTVRSRVEALTTAGAASSENIHTGSSATGWSGTYEGAAVTPTVSTGKIRVASPSAVSRPQSGTTPNDTQFEFTATLPSSVYPIDTSVRKFISADVTTEGVNTTFDQLRATINGTEVLPVASTVLASGLVRVTFEVPTGVTSVTALILEATIRWAGDFQVNSQVIAFLIDSVDTSNTIPQTLTAKQLLRTMTVKGAAPTEGSIAVEHSSTVLNHVLLFTYPDDGSGYQPSVREHRVSGNTVSADSAAVSGSSEPLWNVTTPTPSVFDVPTPSLPDGEYQVAISAKTALVGVESYPITRNVTWSFTPRRGGLDIAAAESYTTALTFVDANYHIFALEPMIHLPLMAAVGGHQRFSIVAAVQATDTVTFDNAFLCNMSIGQLTTVNLSANPGEQVPNPPPVLAGSQRLWIDSPSLENDGRGDIWRGNAADRSDAYSAWPYARSVGRHRFDPQRAVKVFSVTSGPTTPATVACEYQAAGFSRMRSDW